MKKLAILSLCLAASAAFATTKPDPVPTPTPGTTVTGTQGQGQEQGQGQTQGQGQGQTANGGTGNGGDGGVGNGGTGTGTASSSSAAQGGSSAGGNAQGGGGGSANVDASTYSATGDVSNVLSGGNSKYISLGFPAPVWTSVPTPYGCLVSESKALSVGWNFASGATSKQTSDVVCTTIRMAEAATLHCQFETAAMLNKNAFEKMYSADGGFFMNDNPRNLKPMECEDLKRPALRMAAMIAPPQQLTNVNVGLPSSPASMTGGTGYTTPACTAAKVIKKKKKTSAPICK